ncbi:hypothetical protein LRS74_33325 [Streptomyces sp. LX-29]|uniref:hypothetical protein n=1 Tax=Streptomyces sp. LX-29 TaxID=2900152 RepID=UPI00240DA2C9|nr:hypothetical protein [Streptomyces sp. LX-29]WFB11367.1 hypothetical protein LRS74_33325 [Streptomyces sp. LX-29]
MDGQAPSGARGPPGSQQVHADRDRIARADRDRHHLTVIGSGSELEALQQRAGELHLDEDISFEPFLPRADLWARFAHFDAMLFTTHQLEAYGWSPWRLKLTACQSCTATCPA